MNDESVLECELYYIDVPCNRNRNCGRSVHCSGLQARRMCLTYVSYSTDNKGVSAAPVSCDIEAALQSIS